MKNNFTDDSQKELIDLLTSFYARENTDIINAIAHDIKNPLGIVELSLGLIEDKLEVILSEQEQELQEKLAKFFNNINQAVERCQVILNNTITLRKEFPKPEKTELSLHKFVNDFYFYAKPALKRSKINFTNKVDESLLVNLSRDTLSKTFLSALIYCAQHIKSTESIFLDVTSSEKTLLMTIYSNRDLPITLDESTTEQEEVFNYRFEKLLLLSESKFEIKQVENKVLAVLTL